MIPTFGHRSTRTAGSRASASRCPPARRPAAPRPRRGRCRGLLAEVGRDRVARDELRERERDERDAEAEHDERRCAPEEKAGERRSRNARESHGECPIVTAPSARPARPLTDEGSAARAPLVRSCCAPVYFVLPNGYFSLKFASSFEPSFVVIVAR